MAKYGMTLEEIAARYKMNPAVLIQMIRNGQIEKSVYEIDAGKLYIHPLAFDEWYQKMVKTMNTQLKIQRMDRFSKATALAVAVALLITAFALAVMTGMWSWLAIGSVFAVLAWGLFQFAGSVLTGFVYGNQATIPCMQLQGTGTPCTDEDLNVQMVNQLKFESPFIENEFHENLNSMDTSTDPSFSYLMNNCYYDSSWSDPK